MKETLEDSIHAFSLSRLIDFCICFFFFFFFARNDFTSKGYFSIPTKFMLFNMTEFSLNVAANMQGEKSSFDICFWLLLVFNYYTHS